MNARTPAWRRGLETLTSGVAKRSVLAALALVALLIVLAAPAASPAGAAYPRSFPTSDDIARRGDAPGKDALHRLQIVANLRAQTPERPLVLLIGGSSARESTVDDVSWAAEVRRRGGPDVTTYNLGCRHDTFAQDLEVVRLLPAQAPTIVYIGINLGRFANPQSTETVTLPEPLVPPPRYYQHIYSVDRYVQPWDKKAYYVRYWLKRRAPQFQQRFGDNLDVLEHVVEACLKAGLHPVLLDLPRDLPVIGHSLDRQVAQVKAACTMLSQAHGIPWVTPVRASGFVDGDFYDLWHLVEPGRVKYQTRLATKTASLLHLYGMDQPASAPAAPPPPAAAPRTQMSPGG